MHILRLIAVSTPALLILSLDLPSRTGGYYNTNAARRAPSCGNCHRANPGAAPGFTAIHTAITPAANVLAPGQATNVTVAVTGGPNTGQGGFACDATAGTFSAGANSKLQASGAAISHSNPSAKQWTFGYTAPTTPGLVEMYAVGIAVDGNNSEDDNDMWALSGFDETATTGTPKRLFVNAPGIVPIGTSCAGGYGNTPVFGGRQAPTVGNSAFTLEVHGAAPNAVAGVVLALTELQPGIDLGFMGVPNCRLYVNPTLVLNTATSGGDAQRGEGTVTIPLPIPAQPSLRNGVMRFQAFFVDMASGRPTPLTFTNGLAVTFQ